MSVAAIFSAGLCQFLNPNGLSSYAQKHRCPDFSASAGGQGAGIVGEGQASMGGWCKHIASRGNIQRLALLQARRASTCVLQNMRPRRRSERDLLSGGSVPGSHSACGRECSLAALICASLLAQGNWIATLCQERGQVPVGPGRQCDTDAIASPLPDRICHLWPFRIPLPTFPGDRQTRSAWQTSPYSQTRPRRVKRSVRRARRSEHGREHPRR